MFMSRNHRNLFMPRICGLCCTG